MRDGTSMAGATVEEVRINNKRKGSRTSGDAFVSVPEKMEKRVLTKAAALVVPD